MKKKIFKGKGASKARIGKRGRPAGSKNKSCKAQCAQDVSGLQLALQVINLCNEVKNISLALNTVGSTLQHIVNDANKANQELAKRIQQLEQGRKEEHKASLEVVKDRKVTVEDVFNIVNEKTKNHDA